jgi:hypothetical protein
MHASKELPRGSASGREHGTSVLCTPHPLLSIGHVLASDPDTFLLNTATSERIQALVLKPSPPLLCTTGPYLASHASGLRLTQGAGSPSTHEVFPFPTHCASAGTAISCSVCISVGLSREDAPHAAVLDKKGHPSFSEDPGGCHFKVISRLEIVTEATILAPLARPPREVPGWSGLRNHWDTALCLDLLGDLGQIPWPLGALVSSSVKGA